VTLRYPQVNAIRWNQPHGEIMAAVSSRARLGEQRENAMGEADDQDGAAVHSYTHPRTARPDLGRRFARRSLPAGGCTVV